MLGLLLNVDVPAASVQDRDGGETLLREARRRFAFIERIVAEGGYQGPRSSGTARHLAPFSWRHTIALIVWRRVWFAARSAAPPWPTGDTLRPAAREPSTAHPSASTPS